METTIDVFAEIQDRNGKPSKVKIGTAERTGDSLKIKLDGLPVSGVLFIENLKSAGGPL